LSELSLRGHGGEADRNDPQRDPEYACDHRTNESL
jgi:hypothetical protein